MTTSTNNKTLKKSKPKPKKPTPQELEQRLQKREIRSLLRNMGFNVVPRIDGKEIIFKERTSEMDDIFYYENIILIVEYTVGSPGKHLLTKKVFYDKVNESHPDFIRFLNNEEKLKSFKKIYDENITGKYSSKQLQLKILYCSKQTISNEHTQVVSNVVFFNYHIVKYFEGLAKIIKKSAKHDVR